ncbi:MAG: hypothetical protein WAR21_00695 [Candidatus Acidiferrales bacterium]
MKKTQEELDDLIRKATQEKKAAVEEQLVEGRIWDTYLLSNGQTLSINKQTGYLTVQGKGR